MFIPNCLVGYGKGGCIIKVCWLREAALLETQLNFVRTCPGQTKDKIRLLIQKLGRKVCAAARTFNAAETQLIHCDRWP